jgi:hypothetical protein
MVMMAKASNLGPYVLLGVGVAGVAYLSAKSNRSKSMFMFEKLKCKVLNMWHGNSGEECNDLLEKSGHPDPYDFEDNRMVDEGAMFSVNYYNKEQYS